MILAVTAAEKIPREIAIIPVDASTSPSDLVTCKLYESW